MNAKDTKRHEGHRVSCCAHADSAGGVPESDGNEFTDPAGGVPDDTEFADPESDVSEALEFFLFTALKLNHWMSIN